MILIAYDCRNCKQKISGSMHVPYILQKDGSKKTLAHPGDCFTYSDLIEKYGKEEADRRYGHGDFYVHKDGHEAVLLDSDKEDVSEHITIEEAIDKKQLKCSHCGHNEFVLAFMGIS